jgi:GTP-binding nuclear protein Ran
MNTQKIVLIGDGQVGKTTFVNMLMGKYYSINYKATLGVEVHPIMRGNKCYNIWDCAGQDMFRGLVDGYYVQAQGAIIMCDPTNLESVQHVEKWAKEFKRIVGEDIPIVYVINKSEILPNDFNDERFVKISCKHNENLEEVLSRF